MGQLYAKAIAKNVPPTVSEQPITVMPMESEQSSSTAHIDWQRNLWWAQQTCGGLQTGDNWDWNCNWSWSWPTDWRDGSVSHVAESICNNAETYNKERNGAFATGNFADVAATYASTFLLR